MRKLVCALLLVASPAAAADLPAAKAVPRVIAYPYDGSGFYFGAFASVQGSRDQFASPVETQAAMAVGGIYGLTVGYQRTLSSTMWLAIEASAGAANLRSGSGLLAPLGPTTGSIHVDWQLDQRIKLGGQLASIWGMLPGSPFGDLPPVPALPATLQAGAVNPTTHPYVYIGVGEERAKAAVGLVDSSAWVISYKAGVGMLQQLTAGAVADLSIGYVWQRQALDTGPLAQAGQGDRVEARFAILY